MGKRKYSIEQGVIYTGRKTHRRVIYTFEHPERGTRVVYSVGGISNRECGYLQFRRWATGNDATKVRATKAPRYQLARARA